VTDSCGVGTGHPAQETSDGARRVWPYENRGPLTDEALRVLPARHRAGDLLGDGLEVTLAPGSVMPAVLVAGTGPRRAAAPPPTATAGYALAAAEMWRQLSPCWRAPLLSAASGAARAVVAGAGHRSGKAATQAFRVTPRAGTERVILAPSGASWQQTTNSLGTCNRTVDWRQPCTSSVIVLGILALKRAPERASQPACR